MAAVCLARVGCFHYLEAREEGGTPKVLFLSKGRRHMWLVMKRTLFLVAVIVPPGILQAHPHEGAAPQGRTLTVAVATGSGDHTYQNVPWWGTAENEGVGSTNGGVALDRAGKIYFSTDTPKGILIYNAKGQQLGQVGPSNIHDLFIRQEGDKEYIWASHTAGKRLVKMTLDGKEVFQIPNEKTGEVKGGWRGVTAADIAPDGAIFIALGYGSNFIHKFDAEGNLIRTFAGKGKGEGQCNTAHGMALDHRFDPPRILVADRENGRLTHWDLDGDWIGVVAEGLRRPTDLAFRGDVVAVTELAGGVKILDKAGKVVALLGENPNPRQRGQNGVAPSQARPAHFTAPHGLAYDRSGNLYVQDWNRFGRISKLVKVESSTQ
ncbi:MAG: 6-bladed beta-propeller [Verrucomicrobiaceae bacterium]|nr:6-bladed beta-propeller [Verrucomicrobiaceae bacterium]